MSERSHERRRFWRLVGMALLGGAILTVINVLISREPSLVGWSNALCRSAMLLGIGSAVPFLFDAGRTFGVAGKLEGDADNRRAVWESEQAKREKGMTVTFAIALAAAATGVASLLASLW